MSRLTLLMVLTVGLLVPSTYGGEEDGKVQILFVQNAKKISFDGGTLTLKGVSPNTVFFSDRPDRIVGHLGLEEFVDVWGEGDDSFAADPPNATLSTFDGDSVRSVVLELSNPRLKKNALAYDVRILGGDVPARGGSSSLFIDGLIGAGIHGAALGAVGGAIGGDTRKGAEIGAGVGAAAHLIRPRRAAYRY